MPERVGMQSDKSLATEIDSPDQADDPSRADQTSASTFMTALIVFGLAALIICAETGFRHQGAPPGSSLWSHRVVIRQGLDSADARRIVHKEAGDRTGGFVLAAGDDCLYLDDANWVSHETVSGDVLVPVFCPAHGAGWASLAFLEKNRTPFNHQ
jgi:hypothetical protein